MVPVSYTHLDVYKRQLQLLPVTFRRLALFVSHSLCFRILCGFLIRFRFALYRCCPVNFRLAFLLLNPGVNPILLELGINPIRFLPKFLGFAPFFFGQMCIRDSLQGSDPPIDRTTHN